jgi:hypothetical protein
VFGATPVTLSSELAEQKARRESLGLCVHTNLQSECSQCKQHEAKIEREVENELLHLKAALGLTTPVTPVTDGDT